VALRKPIALDADDKSKSLPRPPGYVPPPAPSPADVLRTLSAVATDILPFLGRLARSRGAPSTENPDGLAVIRAAFARTLRRLGVQLHVRNAERVPASGGLVFMWKQESHLDHLLLPVAIPRAFVSLYNNEIARFPIYGEHMRRGGHLHVDRTDEAQWRASVARAAERARSGTCILVSPEGTRSWDGNLLPMKRGAFILAEAAAQPIVCVTVVGGHERMPRGSPFVRKGPIHVVFSDPIPTAGDTADRLAGIVADTFRATKARYPRWMLTP
jgi:1-acyl-sn-glycerol-3-phosphate acyltransferase